ncbi:PilZ domain protein [uncultured delta proteobacterium]|uniref:PilZ domain protein n=1 Tax=uncultured delta proteobacterium TaxID=34034 RepID=A0A212K0M9_9DELT|nr:PilZ domain protein [uncultured delta proteobacterium]
MTQELQKPQEKPHRTKGDKLELAIGTRMAVTLDTTQQGPEGRIAADLVGMVHFEYLILRLPWVPGLRSRLVGGASVTVRFVSNGELCGFQSPVITHIPKPSLLLFLEYPDVIEKMALRQHKRVQCALPVQLHSRRGDAHGVIADLSRSGCRMAVDVRGQQSLRQTVVEDVIVLRVPLNSEGLPLTVTCTVRSVSFDANRMQVGLSFSEADTEFWNTLEAFLTTAYLLA